MAKYKPVEYLTNSKVPVQLLGLSPLMNPLMDHVSSQRGVMFSNHLPQAQVLDGCEFPRMCGGFEHQFGIYEANTTERDQDIQIIEKIPRFVIDTGMMPIRYNPYHTIIYRGDRDNAISYFNREKFTFRSNRYGYENVFLNEQYVNTGTFIPKDVKLCTSPAHKGNFYCMGTNLNVAYMSIPQVTEDGIVISEDAARKLSSTGMDQISFKILPNQVPLNLYGNENEYKFLPDVGEFVNDDCIVCALRTPTANSLITDISQESLTRVQFMHDSFIYVPKGSQIVDINIVVNRKCKIKTPMEIFSQVYKYREAINKYNFRVWEAYQRIVAEGRKISPEFNTLVKDVMESLLADGQHIPGFTKRADVTLVKKKELIEFIYVTITFKYKHMTNLGSKCCGSSGNKGVCASIWKNENMPIDEQGIRADVIMDPVSIINRMNPSQSIEQYINRGSELLRRQLTNMSIEQAYNLIIDYLTDCNPKWGALVDKIHNSPEGMKELVKDSIDNGIIVQINPFQEGIDTEWVLKMENKWHIGKSCVTYGVTQEDGSVKINKSKHPVMIGSIYMYKLYKMPHLSASGFGFINQYRSPVRPSTVGKYMDPYSRTTIRFGEDECRAIVAAGGPDVAARFFGVYANSPIAVSELAWHLIDNKKPTELSELPISTDNVVRSNTIIGVAKHMFATMGINITPPISKKVTKIEEDASHLNLPVEMTNEEYK